MPSTTQRLVLFSTVNMPFKFIHATFSLLGLFLLQHASRFLGSCDDTFVNCGWCKWQIIIAGISYRGEYIPDNFLYSFASHFQFQLHLPDSKSQTWMYALCHQSPLFLFAMDNCFHGALTLLNLIYFRIYFGLLIKAATSAKWSQETSIFVHVVSSTIFTGCHRCTKRCTFGYPCSIWSCGPTFQDVPFIFWSKESLTLKTL